MDGVSIEQGHHHVRFVNRIRVNFENILIKDDQVSTFAYFN